MLEVRNLTKIYPDGTVALKNVSFTVADGEFLSVIGLSGSGKSTLLRCINRLIEPTEGDVILNGVNITELSRGELYEHRRRIGMIFQAFNLVNRLTVLTNVMTGRLGYTSAWNCATNNFTKEDKLAAQESMSRLGIRGLAEKRCDELSGGQKQRVAICRALMQNPEIILADEPVASLDPVLAHSILNHLKDLNIQTGVTILCSLHYLDLIQEYSTSTLGLRDGEVVYQGTRGEIQAMTDVEFKTVYGSDAVRVGPAPQPISL